MNDAGRIGFVPRGQYSNEETYDFLDFVTHGNASYVAKKLTVGNEPQEGSEYWQMMVKTPGGAVTGVKGSAEAAFRKGDVNITAEDIGAYTKEYIDSNSTSSVQMSIFNSAGWYRVAKTANVTLLSLAEGASPYSCILTMKRRFSTVEAEYHSVRLVSRFQHSDIVELSSSAYNDACKIITAVRHTVDSSAKMAYLEIYYSADVMNSVHFTLSDNYSDFPFAFMNPEKTADTLASGVVKYSQCNLSANNPGGDAGRAGAVRDASGNGKDVTLSYYKPTLSNASYLAAWNTGELRAINPTSVSVGRAVRDGAGDVIADTYQKKAWSYIGSIEYRGRSASVDTTNYSELKIIVADDVQKYYVLHEYTLPVHFIKNQASRKGAIYFENETTENFYMYMNGSDPEVNIINNYYSYMLEVYAR